MVAELRSKFEGWFATSFWVDMHYACAVVGTLLMFVRFVLGKSYDSGMAEFVGALWVTAIGNDKINMPPVAPPPAP